MVGNYFGLSAWLREGFSSDPGPFNPNSIDMIESDDATELSRCSKVRADGLSQCSGVPSDSERTKILKNCQHFEWEQYEDENLLAACTYCWIEDSKGYCEKMECK